MLPFASVYPVCVFFNIILVIGIIWRLTGGGRHTASLSFYAPEACVELLQQIRFVKEKTKRKEAR